MNQSKEWLLKQNSELRHDGIYNWTIPAWAGRMLGDGRPYNTCPEAGSCRKFCYALAGTYRFSNVRAAHERNLRYLMDDLEGWEHQMSWELTHRRYLDAHVRIHDAGDFYSDEYLAAWLRIIRRTPQAVFYAYTKAVDRFKRMVEPERPWGNFFWVYSEGGREDHLIDRERDRYADVFTDMDAMEAAGYACQDDTDLLAVYGPRKVGIPANNLRHLVKRQGEESFAAHQRREDAQRAGRRGGVRAAGDGR